MLPKHMKKAIRNVRRIPVVVAVVAGMTAFVIVGCGKKTQEALVPPPSVTTLPATQSLPVLSLRATNATVAAADTNQVSEGDQTQAELAAQVKQLETEYQNTPDFQKRVAIIYELSSNDDGADVIDATTRLFMNETDQELKIEMINSLTDIDGQKDKKLAILSTALRADQPKEVRLEAIDGMGDAEDKRAIQVLQGFLNDPDEDIKQNAQDTIEQLQSMPEQPAS
jgi:hypothetical protein